MPYPQHHAEATSLGGIIASRLPFEIVSLIISFMTGPKSTVLPLARVSRHWTFPANAWIYRKVVISRARQWPWLVWTLHVNPSLRTLVRILKITVYIPHDQRRIGRDITANLFPHLQEAVYFWNAIDFSFLYTLTTWAPSTLRSLYVGIDSLGVLRFVCDFLQHHQDWPWDELTFDIRPTLTMIDCQGTLSLIIKESSSAAQFYVDLHIASIHVKRLNFLESIGDHACPSKPPAFLNLLANSCLEDVSFLQIHLFPSNMISPNFDGGTKVPVRPLERHDGRYIMVQHLHLAFHNFKEISYIERFQLFWLESLFRSRRYTLETGTANLITWSQ